MPKSYRATLQSDRIRWHDTTHPDSEDEPVEVEVVVLDDLKREPAISRTPGVCGGDACFAEWRIPVWLVVDAWQMGWTDEEVLAAHPVLNPSHLAAAREYYGDHRQEIDRLITENAAA